MLNLISQVLLTIIANVWDLATQYLFVTIPKTTRNTGLHNTLYVLERLCQIHSYDNYFL